MVYYDWDGIGTGIGVVAEDGVLFGLSYEVNGV